MSATAKNLGLFSGDSNSRAGKYGECSCGRYSRESALSRLSNALSRSLSGEFNLYWH